jgi:hypothetical protein
MTMTIFTFSFLAGGVNQKKAKNKKRNWKQIRHDDVDSFLDEMREDERLGGIKGKTNEALYMMDSIGFVEDPTKTDVKKNVPNSSPEREDGSTGPLVKIDDLKCFTLLKPHTSVPDPLVKRYSLAAIRPLLPCIIYYGIGRTI